MNNFDGLPASVIEIAKVIGRDAALRLIGQLPTTSNEWHKNVPILYIPKSLPPGHRLVRILGWEKANALVAAFKGEIRYPAACREIAKRFRDGAILQMLAEGSPPGTVAVLFDVSLRTVRNLARKKRQRI